MKVEFSVAPKRNAHVGSIFSAKCISKKYDIFDEIEWFYEVDRIIRNNFLVVEVIKHSCVDFDGNLDNLRLYLTEDEVTIAVKRFISESVSLEYITRSNPKFNTFMKLRKKNEDFSTFFDPAPLYIKWSSEYIEHFWKGERYLNHIRHKNRLTPGFTHCGVKSTGFTIRSN